MIQFHAARSIRRFALSLACFSTAWSQKPPSPTDITPIDGEQYYLVNQQTGLQVDLDNGSTAGGTALVQQARSFTSLTQRWALTLLPSGTWKISNISDGLCLDSAAGTTAVQNACASLVTQQWALQPTTNGYYTLVNQANGALLDLSGATAGSTLALTASSGATPAQSQQWLLRPAFFRGVDNALLEKQEADKVANGVPWWNDAGQVQDVLQILKNHGVNMIRIRPSTVPPYNTYTSTTCSGNGCYAETDAMDLDLARRAKQLGMSVELTLLYDGGSSVAVPGSWASDSLTQAGTDVYNYVKAEVEAFRSAGAMPDLVSIGNEVDTGFLNALGSAPRSSFANFAALEKQGMQAVLDASSDPSIGAALPAPLRCIHITPAYTLTSFFTSANTYGIPYDAMCQSYYPLFHGPLTAAQAAATNPSNKPVEQAALIAATALGKPIFLIEVGEHYENGFDANDPWYPTTVVGQRQFLVDVDGVLKGLPNNLGMGMEYWDATGINVYIKTGGYSNGDGKIDALYSWAGLTLFDNADTAGYSNAGLPNFSATLPGLDTLGGKEDQTLAYKLVNVATGQILETSLASTAADAPLDTALDTGIISQHQQWIITSNGDGYFQIANGNQVGGVNVLDNGGSTTASTAIVQNTAAATTASQEWNIVTAANGYFGIVNKLSGEVLTAPAPNSVVQSAPSSLTTDWVISASPNQLWKIVPAHISAASTASQLLFAAGTPTSLTRGSSLGVLSVDVTNSAGAIIGSPQASITLAVTGPQSFTQQLTSTSSNGVATFDLSAVALAQSGTYTLSASATGLQGVTQMLTVTPAPTSTALSVLPTTLNAGTSTTLNISITSTVSGTPTGTVAILSSGTQIASTMLSGSGTLAFSLSTLPPGPAYLSVQYLGDTSFAASTSNVVAVTVNPQNVWIVNATGSLSALSNTGAPISSSAGFPGGGAGIAIDNAGFIWSANAAANTLSKVSNTGAAAGVFSGGGLNAATALAIDGSGNVWVADSGNALSLFSNSGTALSPAAGFTGNGLSSPSAVALDQAGSVWIANAGNASVTQFLGAADPVVTPLVNAVATGALGAKP